MTFIGKRTIDTPQYPHIFTQVLISIESIIFLAHTVPFVRLSFQFSWFTVDVGIYFAPPINNDALANL